MNGAIEEPCVSTTRAPNSTSTSTMGPSHHFLRTRRKSQTSRANDGWAAGGTGGDFAPPSTVVNLIRERRWLPPRQPCFIPRHGALDAARGGHAHPAGDPAPEARSRG